MSKRPWIKPRVVKVQVDKDSTIIVGKHEALEACYRIVHRLLHQ